MSGRQKEVVFVKTVPMNQVNADERLQMRAEGTDPDLVAEYAEKPEDLEPIEVWHDGAVYWVSDGHHTVAAYKKAGKTSIPAKVHQGDFAAAQRAALKANSKHGRRRSRKTIRHVIELAHVLYPGLSVREMAETCDIAHSTIGDYRSELVKAELKRKEKEEKDKAREDAKSSSQQVSESDSETEASNDKDLGDEKSDDDAEDPEIDEPEEESGPTPLEVYNAGIKEIAALLNKAATRMRDVFGIQDKEVTNRYAARFFSVLSTTHDCLQLRRTILDGAVVDILPDGTPINARDAKKMKGAA